MNRLFVILFGFCVFVGCFTLFSLSVEAAQFSLQPETSEFFVGNDVRVRVLFDAESESINTVSAKITIPQTAFAIKNIVDGNSSVNFWFEKPTQTSPGEITFSGITPGGLSRNDHLLFTFVIEPKKEGTRSITIGDMVALINDGFGTAANVTASPLALTVAATGGQSPGGTSLVIEDTDMPEDFVPIISSSSNLFSGKYFVVFSTQDKGSGIDHYEVREGRWGEFEVAQSPYELKDQSLKSTLYIKAVDKKGNFRIVSTGSKEGAFPYRIGTIIAIVFLICLFVGKRIWKKSRR